MIKVRLQIGDEQTVDTAEAYGLIYISSDNRFRAPIKPMERTSYPEEEGEHINPRTVDDAFDYKVTFFVNANGTLGNANSIISRFNSSLYDTLNGVKTFKTVRFLNDYKKVMIVGTPSPIEEATEFWRDANGKQHDVVCVEWTIRVSKPSLCDFNLMIPTQS